MTFGHLQEYETESLVRELASRFDHFIISARRDETDEFYDLFCEWNGDPIVCKGLTVEVRELIGNIWCE